MAATVTLDAPVDTSPRSKARMAGVFYLLTILMGLYGQGFISDRLVASNDAAATASNILAHEPLFRLGFAIFLVELGCQIVMTALLYDVLKPAGRSVSRLAAIFGITGCIIKIVSRLFFYAPLLFLGNAQQLSGFNTEQVHGLALLLLRVNAQGAAMAMIFFGVYALMKGYLILRSTFLPHWLGIATIVGGSGWLAFLSPPLAYRIFPVISLLGLVAALASIGWFLVYGVNETRWREQARAAASSIWT